ncbi:post-GPI attachment to proteins factor 4-like [Ruditapes philippinarum]|uniref:post-GPI attachment to proteins factor 4-like n=1 Tax=Ruditapes philippinarum TaxID=129788 RepID=UPI00295B8BC9|nr:post-GPI attachment to proteins factor 4-like [Ruditapes philippinarum]
MSRTIYLGVVYAIGILLLGRYFKGWSQIQKARHVEYFKEDNQNRVAEAKSVLSNMKTLNGKENIIGNEKKPRMNKFSENNEHTCVLAINIITLSRENNLTETEPPHYLLQTVAALIKLINRLDQNYFQIYLSICNVDLNPETYVDMNYIPEWITIFQRDKEKRESFKNRYEKEREDYVFCMKNVLEQNSSFLLILEDDTLPHQDLFSVMKKELFENDQCELKKDKFKDLFYVKLHTNSWDLNFVRLWRWTKFLFFTGFDLGKVFELMIITLFLDVLIIVALKKYSKLRLSYHMFFILFIYIAWVLNVIGRQNISIVWRYILGITHEMSDATGGSLVAAFYPRASAEATVQYLNSVECDKSYPKDVALNRLARKHWQQLLLIEPPLFTHMGYHSTKGHTAY